MEEKSTTDIARKWHAELDLAKKTDEKWVNLGKRIVKRYRDERSGGRKTRDTARYNILWSNVQTLLPAVYSRTPRAEVVRRNKDNDPASRCAAEIVERVLQYEISNYGDFASAMKGAVTDRLLPGRGVAWIRYEQEELARPGIFDANGEPLDPMLSMQPPISTEYTCVDYVYWEDFRTSPARTWEEVTWVARRAYMTKDDISKRFGEMLAATGRKASDVPLVNVPIGMDDLKYTGAGAPEDESLRKAEVWEIWDKSDRTVYWVAQGFDDLLDARDDPYGLECFFPCPKPLYATTTSDTLVPVPDYAMYQDQAIEMDMLTQRISMLAQALKVVGVYDASATGVQRMLDEGVDNALIPVDTWAMFAEKGGIRGTVDFMPLDQVVGALNQCYMARDQCRQVIYEITGMSDIMRGASVASETATAQNLKSRFGALRLRTTQNDVAMFASEILRIKAQIIMDVYSPEYLVEVSGIMDTFDAPFVGQAINLMKTEPLRCYRIEVASDSLIEMDQEAERQARMEFLSSAGGFLKEAIGAASQAPEIVPLAGEMLMFGVRGFKAGREMEAAFQQFVDQASQPKEQGPDPAQMQMQMEAQQAQMKMQMDAQIEQAKLQASVAGDRARMEADMRVQQMRIETQAQLERQRADMQAQLEQLKMQAEVERNALKASMDMEFNRWKAELDAATKIQVANINSSTKLISPATIAADEEIAREIKP